MTGFLPYPPPFLTLLPFHCPASRLTTQPQQPQETDLTVQDALIDGMVEALVVTDADGTIERFNKTAENMFGYSQQEAIGQNVQILMPPADAGNHAQYMSHYMRTGEARIIGIGRELEGQRKDGTRFPIHLSIGEFNYKGIIRFVGMMQDLTDHKKAEEQKLRLQTNMLTASRLTTMGEMAAAIAHEINQPLAAIANYASACERLLDMDSDNTDDIRSALDKIKGQSHRAGDIIRRLRSFVKPDSIKLEPTKIKAVIDEIRPLAEVDANANNMSLSFDISEGLPEIIADQLQIQQVLLNLIRNGIDAMGDTPPADRKLEVQGYIATPDSLQIDVIDRGHGINDEVGEHLFNPLYTTKSGGMGMGLAISHTIVKSHGGTLTYSNNAGGGVTFSVTLPTKVAD